MQRLDACWGAPCFLREMVAAQLLALLTNFLEGGFNMAIATCCDLYQGDGQ